MPMDLLGRWQDLLDHHLPSLCHVLLPMPHTAHTQRCDKLSQTAQHYAQITVVGVVAVQVVKVGEGSLDVLQD